MDKIFKAGLIILVILSSCKLTKQQRADNRVVKKIEKIKAKHPDSFKNATTELVRIDTVIKEVKIAGETTFDTIKVNNLLTEYLHDTVEVDRFITRFIEVAKDTIQVDTLGLHLWIEGVAVSYTLQKDEAHIISEKEINTLNIQKTEVVNKIPLWVWVVLAIMGLVTIASIIKK